MSKSKKGSAITPDKPVDSDSIMNEIEQEKENRKNEEGWAFNKGLEINRIATIAEIRAGRPDAKYYIRDEDKIVERILEAPLPWNEYVDFDDDSDRGNNDLATFCTRLAVRLMTLNYERSRIKLSPWSSDQDGRIKLIDGAIELVAFVLSAPTTGVDVIEKRLENYEHETGLCVQRQRANPVHSHPPDNQLGLENIAYWKELSEAATKAIDLPPREQRQSAEGFIDALKKTLERTEAEAYSIRNVLG